MIKLKHGRAWHEALMVALEPGPGLRTLSEYFMKVIILSTLKNNTIFLSIFQFKDIPFTFQRAPLLNSSFMKLSRFFAEINKWEMAYMFLYHILMKHTLGEYNSVKSWYLWLQLFQNFSASAEKADRSKTDSLY